MGYTALGSLPNFRSPSHSMGTVHNKAHLIFEPGETGLHFAEHDHLALFGKTHCKRVWAGAGKAGLDLEPNLELLPAIGSACRSLHEYSRKVIGFCFAL